MIKKQGESMTANWSFKEMSRSDISADPVHGEFFNTEALGSYANALVREGGQNILDAIRPGAKAQLRIFLSQLDGALPATKAAKYFGKLWQHLKAKENVHPSLPDASVNVPFLTIEDFGTTGLTGDPAQFDDEENQGGNNFYYFWRNVGRSKKKESARGRWGLGKMVFPIASDLYSFLGLTIREDGRMLFMGQSVLKMHHLSGKRYSPYGFFGVPDSDGFVMPVEASTVLDELKADFKLNRSSETGLSIVIPFPKEEISQGLLAASIAEQYCIALVSDVLSAVVETPSKKILIDKTHLAEFLKTLPSGEQQRLEPIIKLSTWAVETRKTGLPELKKQTSSAAPKWSAALLSTELLDSLRSDFAAGERIAVRVPVNVKPLRQTQVLASHFDIFLERDPKLQADKPLFVREGITISAVSAPREKNVRSLVLVDSGPLAGLLGDSENPAHTEWQERSPKFKDKYEYGAATLRFVRNSVSQLLSLISANSEVDKKVMQDIFSIPDIEEAKIEDQQPDEKEDEPVIDDPPHVPPSSSLPKLKIEKCADGFAIRAGKGPLPPLVAVQVAYDVRTGNPFKRYQPADFQLENDPIVRSIVAGEFVELKANKMLIRPNDETFEVKVLGFDVNRDLRIRAVVREPDDSEL